MRLDGKTVVITGGSRGFGLEAARQFGLAGARVVIGSRSKQGVQQAVDALTLAGLQASGIPCDVSQIDQVESLAAHAVETFGSLDIWVNNAALSAPYGPTIHIPTEKFVRAVQTDVFGVYHGSLVAMRYFLTKGTGKLINISGRGDRQATPMQNAYASSKAWVRSFTLALAKEYKDSGVSVFLYNPGLMTTDLLARPEVITGFEKRLAPLKMVMRLWGNPPDVPARRLVWVASSETDSRTGVEYGELSTSKLLAGIFKAGLRKLTGRPEPPFELEITTIPAASTWPK